MARGTTYDQNGNPLPDATPGTQFQPFGTAPNDQAGTVPNATPPIIWADPYRPPLGPASPENTTVHPPGTYTTPAKTATAGGPPTLNLADPASRKAFREYYGNLPGADPSLLNDPNYWDQKMASGEFGSDASYIANKMQTAWNGGGSGGGTSGSGYSTYSQTSVPGVNVPGYGANQFSDPATLYYENLLKARAAELQQPVNDPSREALARLLDQQTQLFQQQQADQVKANEALKQRQTDASASRDRLLQFINQRAEALKNPDPNTQAAIDALLKQLQTQADSLGAPDPRLEDSITQLVDFLNQRVTSLQGPQYTGAQNEVFRTAALDPIEADRQAAVKRALDNVGSRGMDPTSGIAQDLIRQVNQGFDQTRGSAQNSLAMRQLTEQEARAQEAQGLLQQQTQIRGVQARDTQARADDIQRLKALEVQTRTGQATDQRTRDDQVQQLLAFIPQAQDAAARGDLEFLQLLNQSVSQLGASAGMSATQAVGLNQSIRDEEQARRQQLLTAASQLYQLPMNSAQLAMSALGQAPNPADLTQQQIQLQQLTNQQTQSNANYWLQLGTSFSSFFK